MRPTPPPTAKGVWTTCEGLSFARFATCGQRGPSAPWLRLRSTCRHPKGTLWQKAKATTPSPGAAVTRTVNCTLPSAGLLQRLLQPLRPASASQGLLGSRVQGLVTVLNNAIYLPFALSLKQQTPFPPSSSQARKFQDIAFSWRWLQHYVLQLCLIGGSRSETDVKPMLNRNLTETGSCKNLLEGLQIPLGVSPRYWRWRGYDYFRSQTLHRLHSSKSKPALPVGQRDLCKAC